MRSVFQQAAPGMQDVGNQEGDRIMFDARSTFSLPGAWSVPRLPLDPELSQQTFRWLRDVGLSDGEIVMAEAFDPVMYTSWIYPTSPDSQFRRAISDFSVWETAIDNKLESYAPTLDSEGRQDLADTLSRMLHGETIGNDSLLSVYSAGWHDLGARLMSMGEDGGPQWKARFIHAMEKTFHTVINETSRAADQWLTLTDYSQIRPWESNLILYVPFVEVANNAFLPDEAASDPRINDLSERIGLIFGLMNDVFSVRREDTGSPTLNAVLMDRHNRNVTLGESVEAVAEWHGRLVEDFDSLANEISADYDSVVMRYVAGIRRLIVGITGWTMESPRYAGEFNFEVQRSVS